MSGYKLFQENNWISISYISRKKQT